MNPHNIYVQGSYNDIHDNVNVYLSIDKAQVQISSQPAETSADEPQLLADENTDNEPKQLPDELQTPCAQTLLEKLQQAGLMDGNAQPVGLSIAEKGMLASFLAERLDIKNLWKVFGDCWGMKSETLRRAWNKAMEQKKTIAFQEKLKSITS